MSRLRRYGLPALQTLVTAGLLAYLVWRTNNDEDSATLLNSFPEWNFWIVFWIIGAIFLTFASFVAATFRWSEMVHALGLTESFKRLFSHFMAGQFASNFLPTTIGGDFVRVARLGRDVGDRPKSFASVVFERLSGWVALPFLIFVGLLTDSTLRSLGAQSRIALIIGIVTLVGLAVLIWIIGHDLVGGVLQRRPDGLRYVRALHMGIDGLKQNRQDAVGLIMAALCYQFILVLAAKCTANALGIEVTLTALMVFLPAVLIAQVLPISIGGFGVREGLFIFFLSDLGVTDAEATLLGLSLGFLTLLCSLAGVGPLVFWGKRRPADAEVVS